MPKTRLIPVAVDDVGRSEIRGAGPYGKRLRVGQTVRFHEPGIWISTRDRRSSFLATHGVVVEIGSVIHTGPPGSPNHIVVMVRVEEPDQHEEE